MRRRDFTALLGCTVAGLPLIARAQRRSTLTIGLLSVHSPEVEGPNWAVFLRSLRAAGFVDGQNLALEYRYASYNFEQLPAMAADLVRRGVALIATGPRAQAVAKAAT